MIEHKLLGCLVGAAAGDALGAPTEMRSAQQILDYFNGPVRDFVTPPLDTFARGRQAGQITDDFSVAYSTLLTLLKHPGPITHELAVQALLAWSTTTDFEVFAGPTTRLAILALKGETVENRLGFLVNDNGKASNGAAMKAAPLALFSKGDVQLAIENCITLSMPTHDNQIALSGACAIAAATAAALQNDADVDAVLAAAQMGAIEGEHLGQRRAKTLAGPSVQARFALALQLARTSLDELTFLKDLSDVVGTGLPAAEAVPTALGLIAYYRDQPLEALYAAVNIGNDTDTIATMVGGILGALHGNALFPSHYLAFLNERNGFDLKDTAQRIKERVYG